MSLDNILLPPFVIQDLFRNSLVLQDVDKPNNPSAKNAAFTTLGNNHQKIVILVSNDETSYLPDDQLNFLLGILSACKLSMEDVAILNIKKNKDVSYTTITTQLKAQKLFLFGVDQSAIELPLQFPEYQVQTYNNQVYLSAPSLDILQNDKVQKTQFWLCLKQIFSL